ncbi:hypothetical protein H671_2g5321 [Cricetulus griseus]|nr:hypothetical protein H671_2g5321 [Cricetulus griseus]
MVDYIDGFSYVEPSLHSWDEANFIMVDDFSDMFLDSIYQDFVDIFASMFMRDIGLLFSFWLCPCVAWVPRFLNFVEYRISKYDLMILWISSVSVVMPPVDI